MGTGEEEGVSVDVVAGLLGIAATRLLQETDSEDHQHMTTSVLEVGGTDLHREADAMTSTTGAGRELTSVHRRYCADGMVVLILSSMEKRNDLRVDGGCTWWSTVTWMADTIVHVRLVFGSIPSCTSAMSTLQEAYAMF